MIPTSNVRLSEVAQVLGVDNNSLVSSSTSENINIWGYNADYAPILINQVSNLSQLPSLKSFVVGEKPPHRLGDFRGYRHGMTEPLVDMSVPSFSPTGGSNKVTLTICKNGLLTQKNLLGYYAGLAFIRDDGSTYAKTLSVPIREVVGQLVNVDIGESSPEVAVQVQDILVPTYLPEGRYTVYAIASSQIVNSAQYNSSFIKLSDMAKSITRSGSSYSVDIVLAASYVSSSRRYTYRAAATNTGGYSEYLTYRVTIINNLDESVWKELVPTTTSAIAKDATLTLASGDGTQVGMNTKSLRVEWQLKATSSGSVLASGVETKPFKSV